MELLLNYLHSVHPMSPELREHLQMTVRIRELKPKEYLLKAGHICNHIYFIERGLLRCYYERANEEVSAWFMPEGNMVVAIESFYDRVKSHQYIQALEPCKLWYVHYDELYYIYRHYPEFNWTGRELTQRYHVLWEKLVINLRRRSAVEKYQWMMDNHPEIIQRVQAKHIATFLDVSEVRLSVIKSQAYR